MKIINNAPLYQNKHNKIKPQNPAFTSNLVLYSALHNPIKKQSNTMFAKLGRYAKKISNKVYNTAEPHLMDSIAWISRQKPLIALDNWASTPTKKGKSKVGILQLYSMLGLSVFLDALYARRTLKSKKIEPDRKHTLAVNFLSTMVFSFFGSIALDGALNKKTQQFQKRFVDLHTEEMLKKNLNEQQIKDGGNKLKTSIQDLIFKNLKPKDKEQLQISIDKTLSKIGANKKNIHKGIESIGNRLNGTGLIKKTFVIAFIYRFVAPVIATPTADKVTKYLKKKGIIETPKSFK